MPSSPRERGERERPPPGAYSRRRRCTSRRLGCRRPATDALRTVVQDVGRSHLLGGDVVEPGNRSGISVHPSCRTAQGLGNRWVVPRHMAGVFVHFAEVQVFRFLVQSLGSAVQLAEPLGKVLHDMGVSSHFCQGSAVRPQGFKQCNQHYRRFVCFVCYFSHFRIPPYIAEGVLVYNTSDATQSACFPSSASRTTHPHTWEREKEQPYIKRLFRPSGERWREPCRLRCESSRTPSGGDFPARFSGRGRRSFFADFGRYRLAVPRFCRFHGFKYLQGYGGLLRRDRHRPDLRLMKPTKNTPPPGGMFATTGCEHPKPAHATQKPTSVGGG